MRGVTSCSPSAPRTEQEGKGLYQKLKKEASLRKGRKTLGHFFDMLSRICFPHVFRLLHLFMLSDDVPNNLTLLSDPPLP